MNAATPRRRPALPDLMLALGVMVAIGIAMLAAVQLENMRRDAWERARESGRNLVTALRRDIEGIVAIFELATNLAVDSLDHPGDGGKGEALRRLGLLWKDHPASASLIRRFMVLDHEGDVAFDSLSQDAELPNLATREYFQARRQDVQPGLHVSQPFALVKLSEDAIGLSRRLDDATGNFRGVAVAIVRLAALRDLFAGMALGPQSSITLHRDDGTTLMRVPYVPEQIGRNVRHGEAFQRFLQAPQGQFSAVAAIDGVERLYSFTRIEHSPLILNVAMARASVEAGWRERAARFGVATGVLVLALLSALLWLRREVARRQTLQGDAARARDAAEAAGQARARFLAVMSHEIRTPMNGVIGMADLLLGTGLNAEQVQYLTTLRASAEHMVRLLSDVLDFSRLDAGRVEFESIPFDPAEVARGACRMMAEQAARKGIRLQLDLPGPLPWLRGDPARLRQVLLNLLSNAVKFTAEGQVRLAVEVPVPTADGLRLSITVADTGIGIAPEALQHLFDSFTQADTSIARRFGGSGLGLSICQRLVEGMGGTIAVESRPGEGSRFRFHVVLPEADRPVTVAEPTEAVAPAARPLAILLAEDDPTNQLVIAGMLRRLGHQVRVEADGVAALSALAETRFDLVLMDIMMPHLDGLSAARYIRASAASWRDVPIIAVSANAAREDEAACRAAGMDDFVAKPLTLDVLAAALERHAAALALPVVLKPVKPADLVELQPEVLLGYAAQLGPQAAEEIRAGFLAEAQQRLARLSEASRAPDLPWLRREAHSLKSSAGALGLAAVAETAARLERAAAGGAATATLLAELEEMMRSGMEHLKVLVLAPARE